jgi:hypothetical protein
LELNRGKVGLNSENRGVNCVDCVHSQVQYSQIDDSPNLRGLGNKMSGYSTQEQLHDCQKCSIMF